MDHYIDTHPDELSWCPTADCKNAFIKDPNDPNFTCTFCGKNYCLNCRMENYHTGMSCKEY